MDQKNQHSENEYSAQSIKDVEGVQVKSTAETGFESGAEIDSGDKVATKSCTKGVFDYYKQCCNKHQDSMVLAQRQKYRSMEQNRKPRDKSTYLWTPYL